MWKGKTFIFVCLLVLVQTVEIQRNLLQRITTQLERVYDYILKNHDSMNIDCIFGVVLSQAFLGELNGDTQRWQRLKATGALIISKTIARLEKTSLFNQKFIEFAFDPTKWQRRIHFNSGLLNVNYGKARDVVSQRDFLRGLAHMSFNESFSDECMLELLRGPDPSTNACKVSSLCRDVMVDNPDLGSGYSTTHRILYLQLSRISGCGSNDTQIAKYCSQLFLESQLIRQLDLIKELQDLLFEEVTLCGMEGFEQFMHKIILNAVLLLQHDEGCYGFVSRAKRASNVIGGNCVDHTTGLGASVLSLFLKYYS